MKKIVVWSFGLAVLIAVVLAALIMGHQSSAPIPPISTNPELSQAPAGVVSVTSASGTPANSSATTDATLASAAISSGNAGSAAVGSVDGTPPPLASGATPAVDTPRNLAATLSVVDGSASIVAPDQTTRVPQVGDKLYEGDSIVTADGGEIHLDMADGGYVAVRPNTTMKVTKYQANGDSSDSSTISLIKGSLRSITGWIGHDNPKNYAITTPTATIGVRGTDHEPAYVPEGTPGQDAGTYDNVHSGGTTISNSAGRIDVTPEHAGFVDFHANSAPRVLPHVPTFYQVPHRHDDLFVGKSAKVMATVEQRRTERVEQHRQELGNQPAAHSGARPGTGIGEHQVGRPAGALAEHPASHTRAALPEHAAISPPERAGIHPAPSLAERAGEHPAPGMAERPGMRPGFIPPRPTMPGAVSPGARLDLVQRMQTLRDNAQRAQQTGQPGMANRAMPGAMPSAMPGVRPVMPPPVQQRILPRAPPPPVDPKKKPTQ